MIIQAPLAATSTSSPSTGASDSAATQESGSSEFLSALMDLLNGAEPEPDEGVVNSAPIEPAIGGGEDATTPSATIITVPVIVAALQPSDIRAARVMAHAEGAAAHAALAEGAGGMTLSAPLMAIVSTEGHGLEAADTAPNSMLSEALPATSLGLPQAVTQESSAVTRTLPAEVPVHRQLQAQVGTPAWTEELGAQLHLMANKGQYAASLRLSPEHLGPLEVQISVKDDKATVFFGAANVDTRAAIEQAMPRLRELFVAQGMSLDQSGVFQHSRPDAGPLRRQASPMEPLGTDDVGHAPMATVRRGLIDTYA